MQPGQVQINAPIQITQQSIGQQQGSNSVLQQNVLLNKALGPVTPAQAGQQVNTVLVTGPTVQLQPTSQPQQANQIQTQQAGQQMMSNQPIMNAIQTHFQVIPSQLVVSMPQGQPIQTGQVIGSMGGQAMAIDTVDGSVNQGNVGMNRSFQEMLMRPQQPQQQQQQQQQMPDQNQRFAPNQQMNPQLVAGQQVNIMSTGQLQGVPNQQVAPRMIMQANILQKQQQAAARMQQANQSQQVNMASNNQLRHLLQQTQLQQQQQPQQMQPGQQQPQVQLRLLSQQPGQMVMQQQFQQQNLQQRVNFNTDQHSSHDIYK